MESLRDELERVLLEKKKNWENMCRVYAVVRMACRDVLDMPHDNLLIMESLGKPIILDRCNDQKDHGFMERKKAWWESKCNVVFDEKPTKEYSGSLRLTGHVYSDPTDCNSEEILCVNIVAPPTTKCIRVRQKVVHAAVEAKAEEVTYTEIILCPGQELPPDCEVIGPLVDAVMN